MNSYLLLSHYNIVGYESTGLHQFPQSIQSEINPRKNSSRSKMRARPWSRPRPTSSTSETRSWKSTDRKTEHQFTQCSCVRLISQAWNCLTANRDNRLKATPATLHQRRRSASKAAASEFGGNCTQSQRVPVTQFQWETEETWQSRDFARVHSQLYSPALTAGVTIASIQNLHVWSQNALSLLPALKNHSFSSRLDKLSWEKLQKSSSCPCCFLSYFTARQHLNFEAAAP